LAVSGSKFVAREFSFIRTREDRGKGAWLLASSPRILNT
jgi:hypothetical protein